MNREIKFRGKDLIHNKWIYGGLVKDKFNNPVILPNKDWRKGGCVDKDTIGQFTGLKDKNGREIYEGDIVEFYNAHLHSQLLSNDPMFYQHEFCVRKYRAVVEFREGCFFVDGDYLYGAAFESVEQAMQILEVEDKDDPFDSEGTEINESIVGYKVIGNIHDNPELIKEK